MESTSSRHWVTTWMTSALTRGNWSLAKLNYKTDFNSVNIGQNSAKTDLKIFSLDRTMINCERQISSTKCAKQNNQQFGSLCTSKTNCLYKSFFIWIDIFVALPYMEWFCPEWCQLWQTLMLPAGVVRPSVLCYRAERSTWI